MSCKHSTDNDLVEFLVQVAKRNSWIPFGQSSHQFYDTVSFHKGYMFFQAEGAISFDADSYLRFVVDLTLAQVATSFFVLKFKVGVLGIHGLNALGPIQTSRVLAHYGKIETRSVGTLTQAIMTQCWEINRPADLEALFQSYDHVAEIYQCPTIFNLPKRKD